MPHAIPRTPPRPQRHTTIAIAIAAACLAIGSFPHPVQAQTTQAVRHYDIPAGPLDQALNRFAAEANILLTIDAKLTAGKQSAGLRGDASPAAGLQTLLRGTGLEAVEGGNGWQLRQAASPQGGDVTLAAVRVSADGLGATTEASGSYTTGEMHTATKLALSIRETPQSVTVLTRQRMNDQNLSSITDVAQSTPGVYLSQSGGIGRPSYFSRGFSVDTVMHDGMPTAVHGYVPSSQANLAIFDRVEVVRGATGLVQGAGNPSAAINLVRKRPTAERQTQLWASAGSWDNYGVGADVGGPLNESGTLRGRVVASGQDARSFRDAEREDHNIVYAVLEADLGSHTTLTVGASQQRDFTNFIWGGLPSAANGDHLDLPRSTFIGADWEYSKSRNTEAFAHLEHHFDNDWTLRIAALSARNKVDVLASAVWGQRFLWAQTMETEESGLDAYASGPFQFLGRTHELMAGASHRRFDYLTTGYYGAYLPGVVDVYSWNPRTFPKPDYTVSTTPSSDQRTEQKSTYLAARFNLTDAAKLIVGGRLDWYDFDNRIGSGDYAINRNLTRYAGLIHDLDQNHSAYASYTDIFKPQTERGIDGNVIDPIVGKNYEVGIKGEYLGGRLNTSASLFRVDQTNRARDLDDQSACPTYPATSCAEAAGLVRSTGVDVEIQGALTPQWQVGAGYTYTHAKYVRDADPANKGQTFDTRIPRSLFKLTTMYHLRDDRRGLRLGGNLYYQSGIHAKGGSGASAWCTTQGAYTVVDLMAGYRIDDKLDLQFSVNNAFDRKYYSSIANGTYWATDVFGTPRNFMLTVRSSF